MCVWDLPPNLNVFLQLIPTHTQNFMKISTLVYESCPGLKIDPDPKSKSRLQPKANQFHPLVTFVHHFFSYVADGQTVDTHQGKTRSIFSRVGEGNKFSLTALKSSRDQLRQ